MENNVTENLKNPVSAEPEKEVVVAPSPIRIKEKRNSKEEKSKKKDERNIDQVMKGLTGMDAEKKLNIVSKKYMEILDENRKLHLLLKMSEKKVFIIQREKDQCESERSKAVLTRSRLESLCRELQRQNKSIKEENLLRIKEEEDKRKDVSAKFQSTLTEITALMTETNEKNVKLHEDNMNLHKKFKTVFEEMDDKEKKYDEMHRIMKEELQNNETRLAKISLEMAEEKEKLLKEKSQMLIKLTEYQNKIVEAQHVEANLRSQVDMYTEKYADFQDALVKSNEVFGEFYSQMEKMSKKIVKLEKETNMWKTRWEKNNNALLEMATEKQERDIEMIALKKKCTLLEDLCKTFQQERAKLISQLKETSQNSKNDNIAKSNNAVEHTIANGSDVSNETDVKVKEQTKDDKTELSFSSNEPSKEHMEDTENDKNDKKVLETVTPKTEEENYKEQVSVEPDNSIKTETPDINSELIAQEDSIVTDKNEEFKVEGAQSTNAVPASGETHTDAALNKKPKEGKKKKK